MSDEEKKDYAVWKTVSAVALVLALGCSAILLSHIIHDAMAFSAINEKLSK